MHEEESQIMLIEDYSVLNPISKGESTQGDVYMVSKEKEIFAAKIFNKAGVLKSEVATLKHLKSPYVLKFIQDVPEARIVRKNKSFQTKDILIMEFAKGGDIIDFINLSPIPFAICKRLYIWILSGLEDIYRQGVAHRDIKLDNILVANDFTIRIADFGHSCFTQPDVLLEKGKFGTPMYKAPEVQLKKHQGLIADLYSATVTLYALCFRKLDDVQRILRSDGNNLQPLWKKNALRAQQEIPEELKMLFISVFKVNPIKRPPLKDLIEHKWIQDSPATDQETKEELEKRYKLLVEKNKGRRGRTEKVIRDYLQQAENREQEGVGGVRDSEELFFEVLNCYEKEKNLTINNLPKAGNVPLRNLYSVSPAFYAAWIYRFFMKPDEEEQNLPPGINFDESKITIEEASIFIELGVEQEEEEEEGFAMPTLKMRGKFYRANHKEDKFGVIWLKEEGDELLLQLIGRSLHRDLQIMQEL